jgi:hypothetical protein
LQDHGGYFRRAVIPAIDGHTHVAVLSIGHLIRDAGQRPLDFVVAELPPHETLNGKNSILGIDDGLVAGDAPHQSFVVLVDRHHRRDEPLPFRGRNDDGLAAHHDRTDRIGGAKIYSNDFTHSRFLRYKRCGTGK